MDTSQKPFERILIVMFENQYRRYVMEHPYFAKLARAGCTMNNYFGCFHPSQTNYIASIAGEICNVTNDTPPYPPLSQQNLVDLLEAKGVTWKAYMEANPMEAWNPIWATPDYPEAKAPTVMYQMPMPAYWRKHNAFSSFANIQGNEERWGKITDNKEFWDDVLGNGLPEYSWYTPDIWNDGHFVQNTATEPEDRTRLMGQSSNWLECVFFANVLSLYVGGGFGKHEYIGFNLDLDEVIRDPASAYANSNIPKGTLIVITFDEADFNSNHYDSSYDGPNQIYTVLLGDMITPGTSVDQAHNHYSLLRTIEKNWDLGSLGKNDHGAGWIRELWGEQFAWGAAQPVGFKAQGSVALSGWDSNPVMVYGANGNIMMSVCENGAWGAGTATGAAYVSGSLGLAKDGNVLMMVYLDANQELQTSTYDGTSWTAGSSLGTAEPEFAIGEYTDVSDGQQKLLLAYRAQGSQYILSRIYSNGSWADAVEVGQLTDGPMAVATLGGAVYIVYKERNTFSMRQTSMNTAPFNQITIASSPDDNTSIHAWSPMDFVVGHYARAMADTKDAFTTNGQMAMATLDGHIHMVQRGRYDNTPQAYTQQFGITGVMTASSVGTNGYGTLDQAGWSDQLELSDMQLNADSPNAMASVNGQLVWVYGDTNGDLQCVMGGYST